jgi:hypothetical protein
MGPEIALAATVIGTAVSAVGAIQQGQAADSAAQSQALQLEQKAGQDRAVAQMRAREQKRQAELLSSRATTLTAAGSGDTSEVGTQDILSGIAGEGQYRSMLELYEGEERAKGNEFGATTARQEGKAAKKAGYMSAIGTVLSGASSMSDSYGSVFGGSSPSVGETNLVKKARSTTAGSGSRYYGGY